MEKINHRQLFEEIEAATGLTRTDYAISIKYDENDRAIAFELDCPEEYRTQVMQLIRSHSPAKSDREEEQERTRETLIEVVRDLKRRVEALEARGR